MFKRCKSQFTIHQFYAFIADEIPIVILYNDMYIIRTYLLFDLQFRDYVIIFVKRTTSIYSCDTNSYETIFVAPLFSSKYNFVHFGIGATLAI